MIAWVCVSMIDDMQKNVKTVITDWAGKKHGKYAQIKL